ncbi:MAG: hypothetical protein WB507_03630, partial [Solirubrobacterales bacterium]
MLAPARADASPPAAALAPQLRAWQGSEGGEAETEEGEESEESESEEEWEAEEEEEGGAQAGSHAAAS